MASKAFAPAVGVEGFHCYVSYTFDLSRSTLDFCLGGQRSREAKGTGCNSVPTVAVRSFGVAAPWVGADAAI